MAKLSRRDFIKISAAGAAAAGVGAGLTTEWFGLDAYQPRDPGTDGDRVVPTFCELCFWKCGVLAHVKDGRVTKLTGNPAHPLSRGRLCPRGVGGTGLLYDPDRLRQPLLRRDKGGQQVFEPVSWDAALDVVASKMAKLKAEHGPQALARFSHGFGGSWFKRLINVYGSANVAAPSYAQCRGPREAGYLLTFGQGVGSPENIDMAHARVITLIGSHLGENMHNTQVQDFAEAIGRGAELVVVDPRYSTAAGKAKYWLPIKPGTDIALLLAWMNVIIGEGRYDAEYVAKHTVGFEALKAHVAGKTPEWAHPLTGLEPRLIRDSARLIAAGRPQSIIHPGRHATWYGDDTQRARAMAILAALLGSWGRRGGYVLPSRMSVPPYPAPKLAQAPRPAADRPKGGGFPLADETLASGLCDATIPGTADYDIRAWLVYGTNLIQSLPNPEATKKAIQQLDFMVAIDVLPAEICGWADVVLPECTYLERCDDLWTPSYEQPFIAIRQPAVDPMYDSKPGHWIAAQIAERLDLGQYFPWKDGPDYTKTRLELAGHDCEEVRRTGVVLGARTPVCEEEGLGLAFDTESGKIELRSETLAKLGFDPIPEFYPPEEPPPGMFRLLFGRSPVHTFGRTTNNRLLSTITSENEVWVNSAVARGLPIGARGALESGDRVVLVNQDGVRSWPVKARVTERIRGDAVYMVHGYGHTARDLRLAFGRGASDSELVTRFKVDPIMGGTGMNVNFVRLDKAGPADEAPRGPTVGPAVGPAAGPAAEPAGEEVAA